MAGSKSGKTQGRKRKRVVNEENPEQDTSDVEASGSSAKRPKEKKFDTVQCSKLKEEYEAEMLKRPYLDIDFVALCLAPFTDVKTVAGVSKLYAIAFAKTCAGSDIQACEFHTALDPASANRWFEKIWALVRKDAGTMIPKELRKGYVGGRDLLRLAVVPKYLGIPELRSFKLILASIFTKLYHARFPTVDDEKARKDLGVLIELYEEHLTNTMCPSVWKGPFVGLEKIDAVYVPAPVPEKINTQEVLAESLAEFKKSRDPIFLLKFYHRKYKAEDNEATKQEELAKEKRMIANETKAQIDELKPKVEVERIAEAVMVTIEKAVTDGQMRHAFFHFLQIEKEKGTIDRGMFLENASKFVTELEKEA